MRLLLLLQLRGQAGSAGHEEWGMEGSSIVVLPALESFELKPSSFFNCEEVNMCDVGTENVHTTICSESLCNLKRIVSNRVNESLFRELNKKRQYIPSVRKTKK